MTQQLPFPIRDIADLRRAVLYAAKHDLLDTDRRYVMSRAKSLGRSDLLPSNWTVHNAHKLTSDMTLDKQFEEQSHKTGISLARLKCVYFRGVDEFQMSDTELGNASMWGLVRVQKYINAVQAGDMSLTDDSDLYPSVVDTVQHTADAGLTLSVDACSVVKDLVYGDGHRIADMFHPGHVTSMSLVENVVTVSGTLGADSWLYTLDTVSGAHNLVFSA